MPSRVTPKIPHSIRGAVRSAGGVPLGAWLWLVGLAAGDPAAAAPPPAPPTLRVATYNVSFYRERQGQLIEDLRRGDWHARAIAEVLQRVRPDLVLLNEFDYDRTGEGVRLFCERYLRASQNGQQPLAYPHRFFAPVNTGQPSGFDLDHDGKTGGPGDAYGWGEYPGQYGLVVLSRFPIERQRVRTFQRFLWRDMPQAQLPRKPDTDESYYTAAELAVFRLSSKSFWDVPVRIPATDGNFTLHLLCSHPTPPVFDGPENRNGLRNHDEIRMLVDYIDPERGGYLVDDQGKRGGLPAGESFVVVGDLNADPVDGGAAPENIRQLLSHPRVKAEVVPASQGGRAAAQRHPQLNRQHRGDARHDTADFSGDQQGNLRVDYVLPSDDLEVQRTAVFWPLPGEPGSRAIRATDHRLVYADLAPPQPHDQQPGSQANDH